MKSIVYIVLENQCELFVDYDDFLTLKEKFSDSRIPRLVYFEVYNDFNQARRRMESIKSWPERKKEILINFVNPEWKDWKKEILNLSMGDINDKNKQPAEDLYN